MITKAAKPLEPLTAKNPGNDRTRQNPAEMIPTSRPELESRPYPRNIRQEYWTTGIQDTKQFWSPVIF